MGRKFRVATQIAEKTPATLSAVYGPPAHWLLAKSYRSGKTVRHAALHRPAALFGSGSIVVSVIALCGNIGAIIPCIWIFFKHFLKKL